MKKGHKYFVGKQWAEITRDERYYCAELFFSARNNPVKIVELINKKYHLKLPLHGNWELGYEVCLYRDFLYEIDVSIKKKKIALKVKLPNDQTVSINRFPQKRTFDLTLFDNNNLVIIEAKVFQSFDTKQLKEFYSDKALISELFSESKPNVFLIGLCRSNYKPSQSTLAYFENSSMLTWADISELYPSNSALIRANNIQKK